MIEYTKYNITYMAKQRDGGIMQMLKKNASSNLFFANSMEYVFRVSIFLITATGTEIWMILITY